MASELANKFTFSTLTIRNTIEILLLSYQNNITLYIFVTLDTFY